MNEFGKLTKALRTPHTASLQTHTDSRQLLEHARLVFSTSKKGHEGVSYAEGRNVIHLVLKCMSWSKYNLSSC
jgi:hypothetical protein